MVEIGMGGGPLRPWGVAFPTQCASTPACTAKSSDIYYEKKRSNRERQHPDAMDWDGEMISQCCLVCHKSTGWLKFSEQTQVKRVFKRSIRDYYYADFPPKQDLITALRNAPKGEEADRQQGSSNKSKKTKGKKRKLSISH